jgi:hypothetical protein
MLAVQNNASITGNWFYNVGNNSVISLGDGTTATNIIVSSNTFIKTVATSLAYNYAIIAPLTGTDYVSAATQSCIISTNTFQGRALTAIGAASIKSNSFNGTYTQ